MNNLIKGEKHDWEMVIGLEIHAQVKSNSKLFSSSSTKFGSSPNSQVSLVDAAMPGMLPVINKYCVEQAVKTGVGLNAKINNYSVFDRKNYFYADLPQGYQISQYKYPIVGEGKVTIDFKDGTSKDIRIVRLHLEQDAGKSLHDQNPSKTYVDLNRSGVALMEIVSEPDIRSADEAGLYISKIRLFQYSSVFIRSSTLEKSNSLDSHKFFSVFISINRLLANLANSFCKSDSLSLK